MRHLLQLYPNDPTKGAPYGTGSDFELTPMWKRIASLMGDMNVIAVRRLFVEKLANLGQNTWTYSTCTLVARYPSQWDLLRHFWQSIAGTRRLRGVQYVVTLPLSLRTSVVTH